MSQPEFDAFISLWDEGRFFEAHEVLEGLWVRTRDRTQQGLIQVAVALHHIQRGNRRGARTMIERALPRLREPSTFEVPVDVAAIIAYAEALEHRLIDAPADEALAQRPVLDRGESEGWPRA